MKSIKNKKEYGIIFYKTEIDTPLGPMLAIANETALLQLDFLNRENENIVQLQNNASEVIVKKNIILKNIEIELDRYFKGELFEFKTPIELNGTDFQMQSWKVLKQIPYGHTITYKEEAELVGNPKAYRAVANANGANPLPIIVPCHRVVYQGNKLGGYSSGVEKKAFLLDLEKKYCSHKIANTINDVS